MTTKELNAEYKRRIALLDKVIVEIEGRPTLQERIDKLK